MPASQEDLKSPEAIKTSLSWAQRHVQMRGGVWASWPALFISTNPLPLPYYSGRCGTAAKFCQTQCSSFSPRTGKLPPCNSVPLMPCSWRRMRSPLSAERTKQLDSPGKGGTWEALGKLSGERPSPSPGIVTPGPIYLIGHMGQRT